MSGRARWVVAMGTGLAAGGAGLWWSPAVATLGGIAAGLGIWAAWWRTAQDRSGDQLLTPNLLAHRQQELHHQLETLESAQELQRGVFEVAAELVGCVDEADARVRFASALRRYWDFTAADLLVWEQGAWRSLGGAANGNPPVLGSPVALPVETGGDLVLDLSAGVKGQAAFVLRRAHPQPSLDRHRPQDHRYVAEVLRGQLALSLRRVLLYGELQALARTDPLTGTHRRWYGEARLQELVEGGRVVSVAMIDIDHFKRVNDQFGHAAGDRVLAAVGRCLKAGLRTGDLVTRLGGEEFLAILPDTGPDGATLVAERLRAAVAALADLPMNVTVSVGVASCSQDDTAAALVTRADRTLYQAKDGGRNRVVRASAKTDTHLRTTARIPISGA